MALMERPTKRTVHLVQPAGVELVSTRKATKLSSPSDLVALAEQVQKGDEFIKANAGNKLTQIAEQIRYLQEQARLVLEKAKKDADLHHAACNLVKKPGHKYYLYLRDSGQKYLSIIAPEEWGAGCPHEFIAAYRLEADQSWTPIAYIEQRDIENAIMDKVLNSQLAITDSVQSGLTKGLLEQV